MINTAKAAILSLTFGLVALAGCESGGSSGATAIDAGAGEPFTAPSDGGPGTDARPIEADAESDANTPTKPLTFFTDFETPLPKEIDPGTGALTPSQGYAPLGPAGNQFGATFLRSATGNTVKVTVSNLPAHTKISLQFLFAAIDSLDGTGTFPAGDFFRVTLDGKVIFRQSFANATPSQVQDYVPPAGGELARHVDLGFQGPGGFYTDSAYDMGVEPLFQNLPHTAASAVFELTLEGEGVQTLDDESWAIDNLRVVTGP